MVTRNRSTARGANRIVWPTTVRDAGPSATATGFPSPKFRRTRVITSWGRGVISWARLIWSIVRGEVKRTSHHSPTGPSDVIQAVAGSPSRAAAGRSSLKYWTGEP